MVGLEIPVIGNMIGGSGRLSQNNGEIAFIRPSQQRVKLEYLNIQNTTVNSLKIYALSDDINNAHPTYEIGGRMAISLKLTQKMSEGVIITFINPDSATVSQVKPLEIIWSEYSKGWNSSFSPSYGASYTGANVNVINTPSVSISGTPAVSVSGTPNVSVANIPAVTVNGTPNVSVTNTPNVNVLTTPADSTEVHMTSAQNNLATSLTQAGVAGKSWNVNHLNWRVGGGAIGASDVLITVKDGTTTIYQSVITGASVKGSNGQIVFTKPLRITSGASVTYAIGASGTAGTIIYANMGLTNK